MLITCAVVSRGRELMISLKPGAYLAVQEFNNQHSGADVLVMMLHHRK